MRRLSLLVAFLVVLDTHPLSAQSPRSRRDRDGAIDRIVQLIKSAFRLQTSSDVLTPPVPGPRP